MSNMFATAWRLASWFGSHINEYRNHMQRDKLTFPLPPPSKGIKRCTDEITANVDWDLANSVTKKRKLHEVTAEELDEDFPIPDAPNQSRKIKLSTGTRRDFMYGKMHHGLDRPASPLQNRDSDAYEKDATFEFEIRHKGTWITYEKDAYFKPQFRHAGIEACPKKRMRFGLSHQEPQHQEPQQQEPQQQEPQQQEPQYEELRSLSLKKRNIRHQKAVEARIKSRRPAAISSAAMNIC